MPACCSPAPGEPCAVLLRVRTNKNLVSGGRRGGGRGWHLRGRHAKTGQRPAASDFRFRSRKGVGAMERIPRWPRVCFPSWLPGGRILRVPVNIPISGGVGKGNTRRPPHSTLSFPASSTERVAMAIAIRPRRGVCHGRTLGSFVRPGNASLTRWQVRFGCGNSDGGRCRCRRR